MTTPYASAAARDADSPVTSGRAPFSFELFPPRTPAVAARIPAIVEALAQLGPEFISVTYGAGGSSRHASLDVLRCILGRTDAVPLAHVTSVGSTRAELQALVRELLDLGVIDFLALRGDPPGGAARDARRGPLSTGAEVTRLIRDSRTARDRPRHVCVAAYPNGHPSAPDARHDIAALLAKQEAGATIAITQLFFEAEEYLRYVERAREAGVTIPILPGLQAITSTARLRRTAELTGDAVPNALERALDRARSEAARREVGVSHAAAVALDVLDGGAPGLHLYTHNRIDEPVEVLHRTGLLEPARMRTAGIERSRDAQLVLA